MCQVYIYPPTKQVFFQTDIYITYGVKWLDYIKKRAKQLKKEIQVNTIGSKYHKKIFDLHFSSSQVMLYIHIFMIFTSQCHIKK